jgi:hypothetical protein
MTSTSRLRNDVKKHVCIAPSLAQSVNGARAVDLHQDENITRRYEICRAVFPLSHRLGGKALTDAPASENGARNNTDEAKNY